MRISSRSVIRFSLILSFLSWLAFVITDTVILFGNINEVRAGIPAWLPNIALDIFILALYVYYQFKIARVENVNFTDLLWRVFATGLLATVGSLVIKFLFLAMGNTSITNNIFVINITYHINFGLVAGFMALTFVVWKKLILYQKSKLLLTSWAIFEYIFLATLLLDLVYQTFLDPIPMVLFTILIIMGFVFSVNLKWVAYLNFKQKWKSILLLLLILLYFGYFIQNLFRITANNSLPVNLLENTFVLAMFSFVLAYCFFSLLVILFNLPTSSVFEQKLDEVINFQKLSQSIQTEKSEEQVYGILLQSACSTVFADAGWIEIFENGSQSAFYTENIAEDDVINIKEQIEQNKISGILDTDTDKTKKPNEILSVLRTTRYRSLVAYPILVQGHQIGTLGLLKEITEGFNKEMTNIIRTFVNQAGISIENFRLLTEALENERYKEELKIAKEVSQSLIPKVLHANQDFEVHAFSEAADEVGGDYYDTYKIDDNRIALIVADVSGKGTSAAFHMSQMKGIFNSLAHLGLGPKEFMATANKVLSESLERASFITASYFIINSKDKSIEFTRAGHCPTLFYQNSSKSSQFFEEKGLGLGIIRNTTFASYLEVRKIHYQSDDILVLYTDGITEAKNMKKQEFGYERLKEIIEEVSVLESEKIKETILEKLYQFCGSQLVDDDYTMLIVKFK